MNRTLIEKARCLLFDAQSSKKFWAEAVNTAVYLQNRIVKSVLNDHTPYELWTGRKPNLSHLRVFGSVVMVHVPKEKRHKWDMKSEKCILIGYSEDIKGYRIYNPSTQAITTSRDVIIMNENNSHEKEIAEMNMIEDKPIEIKPCQSSVGDSSDTSGEDSFVSIESTYSKDETYVPSEESITSEE
jgi:hypothetical protein